jgi:hypothetical protein
MEYASIVEGATTEEDTLVIVGDDAHEAPAVEVQDSTDTEEALSLQFPPYFTLQWWGLPVANYYRIDEYDFDTEEWVEKGRVAEDGYGYHQWISQPHADGETPRFRVTPIDCFGNEGAAVVYDFTIVCNPQPPAIDIVYDEDTGNVEITARS